MAVCESILHAVGFFLMTTCGVVTEKEVGRAVGARSDAGMPHVRKAGSDKAAAE